MKNIKITSRRGKYGNILLLIIALNMLFGLKIVKAQQAIPCGSEEYLQEQMEADPLLKVRMASIEAEIKEEQLKSSRGSTKGLAGPIIIPVVVHVVYNSAAQNISDAQIQSQIDVLNEDYSRSNADRTNTPAAFQPYASNTNIQFVLAKRDPNGNSTTGITRTYTTRTSFTQNNYVKFDSYGGKNAWPRDQYLNIWVCNLSYAGYSTYPGATASIDGVVIKYQCFGRIGTLLSASKQGRTTTHEVGHWLSLEHTWGLSVCGDDLAADTPTQEKSNSGFPVFPHVSSCSPNANGDMFMNYMDYTDDRARNMFTQGQSSRMLAILNGVRSSLLTSLGGIAPGGTTSSTTTTTSTQTVTTTSTTSTTTATSSTTMVTIGNSTSSMSEAPYGTELYKEHIQFIVTKSELASGGYNSINNTIQSLSFFVNSASAEVMNNFAIKIVHTPVSEFSNSNFLNISNAITVYNSNFKTSGSSWNKHTFTSPFVYNGTDNLLIDIIWINTTKSTSSTVNYSATATPRALFYRAPNTAQYLNNNLSGTLSLNRANMRFEFIAPGTKNVLESTVIDELNAGLNIEMEIYPNPVNSKLNIVYNSISAGEIASLTVLDLTGSTTSVLKNIAPEVGPQIISIDFNTNMELINLKDGIYILALEVNGTFVRKKFILMRN